MFHPNAKLSVSIASIAACWSVGLKPLLEIPSSISSALFLRVSEQPEALISRTSCKKICFNSVFSQWVTTIFWLSSIFSVPKKRLSKWKPVLLVSVRFPLSSFQLYPSKKRFCASAEMFWISASYFITNVKPWYFTASTSQEMFPNSSMKSSSLRYPSIASISFLVDWFNSPLIIKKNHKSTSILVNSVSKVFTPKAFYYMPLYTSPLGPILRMIMIQFSSFSKRILISPTLHLRRFVSHSKKHPDLKKSGWYIHKLVSNLNILQYNLLLNGRIIFEVVETF